MVVVVVIVVMVIIVVNVVIVIRSRLYNESSSPFPLSPFLFTLLPSSLPPFLISLTHRSQDSHLQSSDLRESAQSSDARVTWIGDFLQIVYHLVTVIGPE